MMPSHRWCVALHAACLGNSHEGSPAERQPFALTRQVSRKLFDQLRSDTLDETISEAGSDEEEVRVCGGGGGQSST